MARSKKGFVSTGMAVGIAVATGIGAVALGVGASMMGWLDGIVADPDVTAGADDRTGGKGGKSPLDAAKEFFSFGNDGKLFGVFGKKDK